MNVSQFLDLTGIEFHRKSFTINFESGRRESASSRLYFSVQTSLICFLLLEVGPTSDRLEFVKNSESSIQLPNNWTRYRVTKMVMNISTLVINFKTIVKTKLTNHEVESFMIGLTEFCYIVI